MKTLVTMNKVVFISEEISASKSAMYTVKYKELEEALTDKSEIEVNYSFGQRKQRMNQLEKLGFSFKETVFYNDDAPYSLIQEVWAR